MKELMIKNASVFQEDGTFRQEDVCIREGRFEEAGTSGSDSVIVDAKGLMAIPGLVDIHFHGCMGYDFCDGTEEAIRQIAEYELREGITSIVPATMTFPEEKLGIIMESAAAFSQSAEGAGSSLIRKTEESCTLLPCAALRGINMEGPFISMEKKGAQNPAYIVPPDADMFRRLQKKAEGLIRFCDIAPETDGAMDFIRELKDEVRISLAHTTADYDTAREAFIHGARHVTHLFNAMPPFSHRAPGVIGAAAENPDVIAELICDGIHIHPSAVRAAFRLFGDERICLISDSMHLVLNVVSYLLMIFTGAEFPVSQLPLIGRIISQLMPLTKSISAMNLLFQPDHSRFAVLLLGELATGAAYALLARAVFGFAERTAQRTGRFDMF